uniref:CXXC motif containing zinc binding protein n=1 Tax=Plectus sambesii TaxID=2011161 RepID=A0A914X0K0_9BILA
MPRFALEVKANMVNVSNLMPEELPDFRWHVKLKCSNCGEVSDHWQYVVAENQSTTGSGRGSANFTEKCKLCSRQNSLDILTETFKPYTADKNLEYQAMIAFDCRGLEPVDFDPRNGWCCESTESSAKFSDVDLTEREWADYDEAASAAVEINEWQHRFVVVRAKK